MHQIILIVHNVRSCLNVGSLLRTADGLGVEKVYLTGYTPYPIAPSDPRLPHLAKQIASRINKSALGAEDMVKWLHEDNIEAVLEKLRQDGYQIVALEQGPKAVKLSTFHASEKIALIVGREVEGIEPEILDKCDHVVEIPMRGHKESFNVSVAAAMALYELTYH